MFKLTRDLRLQQLSLLGNCIFDIPHEFSAAFTFRYKTIRP
jgi:hypothetical protein